MALAQPLPLVPHCLVTGQSPERQPFSLRSFGRAGLGGGAPRTPRATVPSSLPGCSSKSFKLYSPKEPPNGNAFPPFHPGTMLDRDVG